MSVPAAARRTLAPLAIVTAAAHLFTLLLVLPFLFASLSYPTKWTAVVGVAALASALVIGLLIGGGAANASVEETRNCDCGVL